MRLPADFEARMKLQLGSEFDAFAAALQTQSATSIRVNSQKVEVPSSPLHPIPWTTNGFFLAERPSFIFDPLFHAGTYYVQEASSMLLEQAIVQHGHLTERTTVLDLCAAPGGKTTHLADLLPSALVVGNEVIRSRARILKENAIKWGTGNIVVTNNDPKDFQSLPGLFDIIAVDAPCSGEGLFRRDHKAMDEWSINNCQLCEQRQFRIVMDIWDSLKEGGLLIYSTCTYNPGENLEQLRHLSEQLDFESLPLVVQDDWGITRVQDGNITGYQCYPHYSKGEGFFISVLRKTEAAKSMNSKRKKKSNAVKIPQELADQVIDWINAHEVELELDQDVLTALPAQHVSTINQLKSKLHLSYAGTTLAEVKRKNLKPAHALAVSTGLNSAAFPTVELSFEDAIRFLRLDQLSTPEAPKGDLLLTFQGHSLGFAKNLGNRLNNNFPKEYRILKSWNGEPYPAVL